jgi:hypothetical protein
MKDTDVKVYKVLACTAPEDTKPTDASIAVQKYVVAEIVEVTQNEKLAQFKNLIITSKPFRLTFFEDQGESYERVQLKDANGKSDAHIAGQVVTRKTRAYYVVDSKTGQPYKYIKGDMKGYQVVATSVKFFVHMDQEIEIEFDRVMRRNATNFVPAGELALYIDHLGLDKEALKAQGIDVDAQVKQQQKEADLLTGGTPPPATNPPATPPAGQHPTPPVQ